MTRPAARYIDICSGHGSCPPRPNIEASDDTFVNSRGAHRRGDAYNIHCSHSGVLHRGSGSTYVNSREQGRIADPVSCGSIIATGSNDTFVGD